MLSNCTLVSLSSDSKLFFSHINELIFSICSIEHLFCSFNSSCKLIRCSSTSCRFLLATSSF
ncbi:hypothetical protein FWK35_00009734 [Aphis craccivora]|uniref:Uncharacterized protein n=1 Tax=Aphis craccivora TaxID=307492 RepID=A0A6G0ZND7_APHCR|nr:hypothetical protein FWK35_00009734 [Aphis craccivora]